MGSARLVAGARTWSVLATPPSESALSFATHAPATPTGLTSDEAARRLRADGPNALPRPRRRSPARMLLAELTHLFALVLWVAALLAWLGGWTLALLAVPAVLVADTAAEAALATHRSRAAAAPREPPAIPPQPPPRSR